MDLGGNVERFEAALDVLERRFMRENRDVDIFVLENNYQALIHLVSDISAVLCWKWRDTELKNRKRPKREFFANSTRHDIFSIVPVYKVADRVIFRFTSDKCLPESVLFQKRRSIGNYSLFTPDTDFIRELFIHNLEYLSRSKKLERNALREKYKIDAKVILSQEEYHRFF
jgi:hypothetical protein